MNSRQAAASAASRLSEAGVAEARFEAEYLVREAAGISRAAFFADAPVRGETKDTLDRWVGRRAGREPGAYITGHREFFGREFMVGPGVLIPRPETELLVELGLRELDRSPHATVFEAGTGSGAVAVSLAASRPQARVLAGDFSAEALRYAAANARVHAPRLQFVAGYLARPVRAADVILANLPYIPSGEIDGLEPEVARWEPRLALDGGPDGMHLTGELIADCGERLRPKLLALEVGAGQAPRVAAMAQQAGAATAIVEDLAGIGRVVCARWR